MTRGERLRAARRKYFRSARTAALALGMPVSTYGAHERAERPDGRDYGPEEARRYARRFGVTPEWLLTGLQPQQIEEPVVGELGTLFPAEEFEPPAPGATVPLVGYVGAAGAERADHQSDLDEMELAAEAQPGLVVEANVEGLALFFRKWLVLCELWRPVTSDLFGSLCVVGLPETEGASSKGGRILLRRIEPGPVEGRYDLLTDFGGESLYNIPIHSVARVTGLMAPAFVRWLLAQNEVDTSDIPL
jgi:hypothetical protein